MFIWLSSLSLALHVAGDGLIKGAGFGALLIAAFSHACLLGRGGLDEHPSRLSPSSLRRLLKSKKATH